MRREGLRRHPPQGRILYLYVVDAESRLEGVVPTRRLLLGLPDQPVAEIMVRRVVALPARTTCWRRASSSSTTASSPFPWSMINGTCSASWTSSCTPTRPLSSMMGGWRRPVPAPWRTGRRGRDRSPLGSFRRLPLAGLQPRGRHPGGVLLQCLQGRVEPWVALAFFIPVVLNLAESVSSQSVSLALQVLTGSRRRGR